MPDELENIYGWSVREGLYVDYTDPAIFYRVRRGSAKGQFMVTSSVCPDHQPTPLTAEQAYFFVPVLNTRGQVRALRKGAGWLEAQLDEMLQEVSK